MPGARSTGKAVAQTASLQEARAAAGAPATAATGGIGGPGTTDPLLGDLRRAGLLPLLVLELLDAGTSYGNQLMERISELTGGMLVVNPNTMYPLLRSLEGRGMVAGQWEHPERRSRRFYRLTSLGTAERDRLADAIAPRLDLLVSSVERIRSLLGPEGPPDG
jgi:PadR family transcriptional regulator, regulatory protein PadR